MQTTDPRRAKFFSMSDGTKEDWEIIATEMRPFHIDLPNRVIAHLKLLEGDYGGYAVDRMEHSLQTATRAAKDGRDEEYVVCALLHDIGDTLGSANHPDVAAAILKPFVREELHWMVEQHGIFQGLYFFDFFKLDRNMRDKYQGHPSFELTAEFCELYDQRSFDPAYESSALEDFVPLVRRVFSEVRRSIYL
jgi:predicted HD phosphohydrolase